MSSDKDSYWKSLNKMLGENLKFTEPASVDANSDLVLTYENLQHDSLQKGIQYALNNPDEIAKLEYELNNGQPVEITKKHLKWAKVFIDGSLVSDFDTTLLIAPSGISIGGFLLDCQALNLRGKTTLNVVTDRKRKTLITKLFGNNFIEELTEHSEFVSCISCTQVIFDSSDVASAIDELIMCLSDRTNAPWRIRSVYIQESLRNVIQDLLTPERLNAASSGTIVKLSDAEKQKNDELVKRFGGKLLESDNIRLLFGVPPKYLPVATYKTVFTNPVAVNFFRTTKELIQLVKGDFESEEEHLASIWTENVGLLYEVTAEINAEIIWNNSIGLFDKNMPSMCNIDFIQDERFVWF